MILRLLHVAALAREVLADVAAVTLPEVRDPESLPVIWDAVSRTLLLLDEEPLVSLVPDQANEILQQGLAKALVINQYLSTMVEVVVDGDGDKLEEWQFRAVELLLKTRTSAFTSPARTWADRPWTTSSHTSRPGSQPGRLLCVGLPPTRSVA
ncbi:hypothetical protein BJF83_17405 [Nocardiopsis sp. CNR-923]|nr:hypothetical protein BJF83_17405 [Nocardiopsis sp. CNR-923]